MANDALFRGRLDPHAVCVHVDHTAQWEHQHRTAAMVHLAPNINPKAKLRKYNQIRLYGYEAPSTTCDWSL